jgi:hypothetical protein
MFNAIKERLWLPHRAAQEYFNNRLTVIAQQEKAYEEAIKTIQSLHGDLSNTRQHPFLSDKLMQKLSAVLEEVVAELERNKGVHANRTQADEIQEAIGNLFSGRVGTPYSGEQLENIYREGVDRYTRKVPPGYKDDGKNEPSSPVLSEHRKYGDLIIWRQIIDKASEVKKGIIFVNDDRKEDWYLIFRGKTLGPRPELIGEFLEKCGHSFYMYQADRFFEFAADHLKQTITPSSVNEIRDLRRQDLERRDRLLKLRSEEAMLKTKTRDTEHHLSALKARLAGLMEKAKELQRWQAACQERLSVSEAKDSEKLEEMLMSTKSAEVAETELRQVRQELESRQSEYAMHQAMYQKVRSELERITEQGRERENL